MTMPGKLLILLLLCAPPLRAALDVSTGQFAANTGSATTTVTVTCQGKAIKLFTTGQTANGSDTAANAMWSIGISDGTNHGSFSWSSDDNVATTNVGKAYRTDSALEILSDGTPTSVRRITGVAFTSATVTTITWDGTPAAAYLVGFEQTCGTDVTDALVITLSLANSTGDKTLTGVGFQPNFGFCIYSGMTAAGTATRSNGSIGFASTGDPANKQFTMAWGTDDGATMTATIDAVSYTNNDNLISYITAGAETVDVLASLGTTGNPSGWNSDGMDYNISNAHATDATLARCLFIKGGQWDVGTTTLPSSATRSITSMSFQPKGLFLATNGADTDATVEQNISASRALSSVGAATSTSAEALAAGYHVDAVLNTQVARETRSDKIAYADSNVDFTQFVSNGFDITAASSTSAQQAGWFAMGDNAAAPVDNSNPTINRRYIIGSTHDKYRFPWVRLPELAMFWPPDYQSPQQVIN